MELPAEQKITSFLSHDTADAATAAQGAVDPHLMSDLIQLAREALPCKEDAAVTLLSHRSDRVVIQVGSIVAKAHAMQTHREELNARLELLAHESLQDIFLTPLRLEAQPVSGGLLATLWPAGHAISGDLDVAPWAEAARLLARLHRSPLPSSRARHRLPRCRAAGKVRTALFQLESAGFDTSDARVRAVWAAAATLNVSDEIPDAEPATLVHGDWHFGQLVTVARSGQQTLRLIDPDDMGLGNPAWDLARPAAFFAAGLIPPGVWESFLKAYCAAGGSAWIQQDDPWLTLDGPARALVVQCAASALVRSKRLQRPLAEAEQPLIEACHGIARLSSQACVIQ